MVICHLIGILVLQYFQLLKSVTQYWNKLHHVTYMEAIFAPAAFKQ